MLVLHQNFLILKPPSFGCVMSQNFIMHRDRLWMRSRPQWVSGMRIKCWSSHCLTPRWPSSSLRSAGAHAHERDSLVFPSFSFNLWNKSSRGHSAETGAYLYIAAYRGRKLTQGLHIWAFYYETHACTQNTHSFSRAATFFVKSLQL